MQKILSKLIIFPKFSITIVKIVISVITTSHGYLLLVPPLPDPWEIALANKEEASLVTENDVIKARIR